MSGERKGREIRVAVIVVSDRSFAGEREDLTGPALEEALLAWPVRVLACRIVPDEIPEIAASLRRAVTGAELVLTAGGTGVGPRDVTPEATRGVVTRELPGFGEEMRRRSLLVTPTAIVSRAIAGTVGTSLVVNLPGSPRGAVECLGFVRVPALHAIGLLGRSVSDCAADREVGPTEES